MIHDPEVQKWYFHMAKDGWEKFRYIDAIRDYNMIIEEFEKSYQQTPVTQRYTRVRILSGMKRAKRELAETIAEYDKFKEFKARNAISE
jgi:hypothetical protein